MTDIFVQLNTQSRSARWCPIGYFVRESGCWEWSGYLRATGYGLWGRKGYAHRVVYEMIRGPIPEGLHLDHLCRNRKCVNPDHLEPVTNRENWLRGQAPSLAASRKTHCNSGHPFDAENTYRIPSKPNRRYCRQCCAANIAKFRAGRKAGVVIVS